jgi:hypothetical protein
MTSFSLRIRHIHVMFNFSGFLLFSLQQLPWGLVIWTEKLSVGSLSGAIRPHSSFYNDIDFLFIRLIDIIAVVVIDDSGFVFADLISSMN